MEVKLNIDGTELVAYDYEYVENDDYDFWTGPLYECCCYNLKVNKNNYAVTSTAGNYKYRENAKDTKLDFSHKQDWQTSKEFIDDFINQTFGTPKILSEKELSSKVKKIVEIEKERKMEYDKREQDPLYRYLEFFKEDYYEEIPGGGISLSPFLKDENKKLMMENLHSIYLGKPTKELSIKDVLNFKERNFNSTKYNTISQMVAEQNARLKKITPKMLQEIGLTAFDLTDHNKNGDLCTKCYFFLGKKCNQLEIEEKELAKEIFSSVFLPSYREEMIRRCDEYCVKNEKSLGTVYEEPAPKKQEEQKLAPAIKKSSDLKKRIARQDLSDRKIIPEKEEVSGITKIGQKTSSSAKISMDTLRKFKQTKEK